MKRIAPRHAVISALLQVPAGWFADAYGPKRALLIVVGFWSSFTAFLNAIAITCWIFMDFRKPIDTSVPKEEVRRRAILTFDTIAVVFVLLTIYRTFFLD